VKKIVYAIAAGSLAVSCSSDPTQFSPGENDEPVGESQEELDVTKTQSLTRKNISGADEATRELDTKKYYDTIGTAFNGTGPSISAALPNLQAFRNRYGFGGSAEQVTYYYNRGDLGLGREMHCVDNLVTSNREIACYVVNFAAGTDATQFVFGQSPQTAFTNMNANHSFATVAMVYRDAVFGANNIFFVVYGGDQQLQRFAALDRTSAQFFFKGDHNAVPGTNFNMHVPTNCLNCHGGASSYASPNVTKALFLPFDLDQFEYQPVSGKTRFDQLTKFKHLNEMVWKVAARSGGDCAQTPCTFGPLVTQLDGWYSNTGHQTDTRNEVFEGNFSSGFVPSGWNANATARTLYTSVIRPMCWNCHAANTTHPFNTEAQFQALQGAAVADICGNAMPHALQTYRLLWQTGGSWALHKYLTATGQSALAAQLAGCGPGNVANVDPQFINAATSAMR
jgi:hypothetical protein